MRVAGSIVVTFPVTVWPVIEGGVVVPGCAVVPCCPGGGGVFVPDCVSLVLPVCAMAPVATATTRSIPSVATEILFISDCLLDRRGATPDQKPPLQQLMHG